MQGSRLAVRTIGVIPCDHPIYPAAPETTVVRIPRMRFRLRSGMIAVAAVAILSAAIVAWMRVDRSEWRQQLDSEMTWTQSPFDKSLVKNQPDEFKASSLLRVSKLLAPDLEGDCYVHRWWLSQGGELRDFRNFRTGSGSGAGEGQKYLTAAELARVQQLISNLPAPVTPSSQGEALLVASLSEGSWVTKVYDGAALPPTVQELLGVLRARGSMRD
jgi:hypothetical protein